VRSVSPILTKLGIQECTGSFGRGLATIGTGLDPRFHAICSFRAGRKVDKEGRRREKGNFCSALSCDDAKFSEPRTAMTVRRRKQ
jgi:hypothetical protein